MERIATRKAVVAVISQPRLVVVAAAAVAFGYLPRHIILFDECILGFSIIILPGAVYVIYTVEMSSKKRFWMLINFAT